MPRGVYERESIEVRFWRNVKKTDGCWLWTGNVNKDGYGKIESQGKTVLVHRLSYAMHVEDIPSEVLVLHHCDVPNCVRPVHLFAGTQDDNIQDSVIKGRRAIGSRHGKTALTEDMVREAIELRKRDRGVWTYPTLAQRYNVSRHTIMRVFTGTTWRHATAGQLSALPTHPSRIATDQSLSASQIRALSMMPQPA